MIWLRQTNYKRHRNVETIRIKKKFRWQKKWICINVTLQWIVIKLFKSIERWQLDSLIYHFFFIIFASMHCIYIEMIYLLFVFDCLMCLPIHIYGSDIAFWVKENENKIRKNFFDKHSKFTQLILIHSLASVAT